MLDEDQTAETMRRQHLKYDYVPKRLTLGKVKDESGAFVTCRYKNDKWMNPTVFERLSGFKPSVSRNSETELKKAVFGAVWSEENTPTSGFSFVDWNKDLYNLYYHSSECDDASECDDVVLLDPRGFKVAVTADNFWQMMQCAGMNMEDGKISHKFAYAWAVNSNRFQLVDAESDEFKTISA